jgi:hypothetical protein
LRQLWELVRTCSRAAEVLAIGVSWNHQAAQSSQVVLPEIAQGEDNVSRDLRAGYPGAPNSG